MDALQKNRSTATFSESSIVIIGLVLAIVGLTLRDSFGFSSLLAALGIGLVIGGLVYLAVDGSELLRLALAFISLVALPLLFYRSVVRLIGASMLGTVFIGALYSRLAE